jgi:hypothetical protein
MRRWLGLMAACSLLALTATGCQHTAGRCDCDPGSGSCTNCGYGAGVMGHAPVLSAHPVVTQSETLAPTPKPVLTTPMTKVKE